MTLVEAALRRRQEEETREVSLKPPEGTCICGCGRPLARPGRWGRPNKTGYSGYCPEIKKRRNFRART